METNCPPGGTGHCNNECPFWKNNKCCPPEHPEGVCPRCQGSDVITIDLFKDMSLNRAERRRRGKDNSQRYKYVPCPECKGGETMDKPIDRYPVLRNFTQCPACGGTYTLANDVLQKEIEKGKMPKESKAFLYQHQSLIAKPTGWLSAPIILTFFDVCSDCGTAYCVHSEERMAVVGNKIPPTGQQFSSS